VRRATGGKRMWGGKRSCFLLHASFLRRESWCGLCGGVAKAREALKEYGESKGQRNGGLINNVAHLSLAGGMHEAWKKNISAGDKGSRSAGRITLGTIMWTLGQRKKIISSSCRKKIIETKENSTNGDKTAIIWHEGKMKRRKTSK